MLKTLAWKEAREALPLIVLAVLAQIYLVGTATGTHLAILKQDSSVIPFLSSNDVFSWIFLVSGLAAGVLGLWQTWWESSRGTFHFLLHRPAKREAVFAVKLLLGMAVCLAVTAGPIVVYSLWAATPGKHASPFEWSMTAWSWQLCVRIPLIYLGAFLSGIRPARWLGSRLFPLATAVFAVLLLELAGTWPVLQIAICLVIQACFVLAILHVARARDYS
jgi:hypothetical protein